MATIFKSLRPSDITKTPFPAYYRNSYTYEVGSSNNSPDVTFMYGERFLSESSGLRVENITHELYDSVMQIFYSPIPYAAYGTRKKSYIPSDSVYVLSITQDIFGEKVVPGSFGLSLGTNSIYDDKKGNLITSASGTGSIIGRIFYDKGIVLIKPKNKQNINPDPLWTAGNAENLTGWELLLETGSTAELGLAQGITEPYPGQTTVAAKFGTRTGVYRTGGAPYTYSVSTGQVYNVSGWVYAGGTTYRAILNNRVPGSDYPMGYVLIFFDSGGNVVGYDAAKTTDGASGWNFVSKNITINNASTASFAVSTFIDGPYPHGFSYGAPVCSQDQAQQGCPGYAWFAGFKVENITSPRTVGLDETGLYITNSMSFTTTFSSSITVEEHMLKVQIDPTEFLYSLNNPTVSSGLSGILDTPLTLQISGSVLPYVTTIGFYNEQNELLVVAKPSVPIQRTSDSIQTFIVKFDT